MKTPESTSQNPPSALLAEFAAITSGTARHLKHMRQDAIFNNGVLSARIKALVAALWSVSARCEPCIEFYMRKARALGATRAEAGEILAIASTMGGCVGETWAVKALAVFTQDGESAACCEPGARTAKRMTTITPDRKTI